jgi:hypothetical protein
LFFVAMWIRFDGAVSKRKHGIQNGDDLILVVKEN